MIASNFVTPEAANDVVATLNHGGPIDVHELLIAKTPQR